MIENATLIRIDQPSGTNASGDPAWTTGQTIAVRCCVQPISRAVQRMVDADKIEADTELYASLETYPTANQTLVALARLAVTPDSVGSITFPTQTFLVQRADLLVGGLSAVRCLLRSE